jgi:glycosyltransferase involved in cell wall biosynthesis
MKSPRIKVVHITEGFAGGICTYMCTVLGELVKKGFDITLICSLKRSFPDSRKRIDELRTKGVTVFTVGMCRAFNPLIDIYSFILILMKLFKNKFDIVHTHCSKAGVLGRVIAVLTGIEFRLHSSHCFAFQRCESRFLKYIYIFIERVFEKITTKFIAVSNSEAEIAKKHDIYSEDKCLVVPNALADNGINRKSLPLSRNIIKTGLGFNMDSKVVTTACRLVRYKGIHRFLEAAKLSRSFNTYFLIVGEGRLKSSVDKFIHKNKLSHKIKLLGYISEMERIYCISDVVILCSEAEAQPYAALEAMRSCCPIIATNIPSHKELLCESKGILVDSSAEKIADAIDDLLSDKAKRKHYAENAYVYFKSNHILDKQIDQMVKIYHSCLRRGTLNNEQPKV